jgi:hypothetical protein
LIAHIIPVCFVYRFDSSDSKKAIVLFNIRFTDSEFAAEIPYEKQYFTHIFSVSASAGKLQRSAVSEYCADAQRHISGSVTRANDRVRDLISLLEFLSATTDDRL